MSRKLRIGAGLVSFASLFVSGLGCTATTPDYSGTQFACSDGVCPEGSTCIEAMCVSDTEVPPDAAIVFDAPVPDAPVPDAVPAATCDDMFSTAPGYELCEEDEESCSFNVTLAGTTCGDACTELGTTCIGAIDNAAEPCVGVPKSADDCTTVRQSNICICARIPPSAP